MKNAIFDTSNLTQLAVLYAAAEEEGSHCTSTPLHTATPRMKMISINGPKP